jgi:hypothetical protein
MSSYVPIAYLNFKENSLLYWFMQLIFNPVSFDQL